MVEDIRVKQVFNEYIRQIEAGKKPAVSAIMKEFGYTDSSCRQLSVKNTITWKQLMNSIPDILPVSKLTYLITQNEDKRVALEAIKELNKLKDRYPAEKIKLGTFRDELKEVMEISEVEYEGDS